MGLLDSLFGGQQQPQDPNQLQGPGYAEKLSAMLAPGLHQALQQAREQQITKAALSQMGGSPLPPGMAPALASNPELMRQAGGAYLPSPGKVEQIPTPGGGAVFMQSGQAPGGGAYVKPVPIGSAQGPAVTAPAPQAAPLPAAAAPASVSEGAQPRQLPLPPPTKPGVIEGTAGDMQDKVMWAKQNGYKPEDMLQFVPDAWRGEIKALWDGTQSVKDLSTRGTIAEGNRSTFLNLAHQMNPNWNENNSEALQTYRKSYMNQTPGSVGFQRTAAGTFLGHLNDALDQQMAQHSANTPIEPLNNQLNQVTQSLWRDPAARANATGTTIHSMATELDKYLGGRAATDTGVKEVENKWDVNASPKHNAAAASSWLTLMEDKEKELGQDRDSNFKKAGVAGGADELPIATPEHEALKAQIRAKIAKLRGDTPSEPAPAAAAPEVRQDAQGNKWVKGPNGVVVPYTGK